LKSSRFLAGAGVIGFMIAAAGCQSGDTDGVLGLGLVKGRQDNPEQQANMVRESELRAYCPRVNLREGTSIFRSYEKKAEEDPNKLIYQASIGEVTRSCSYGPGTITVNVALAGKVVPGPLAQSGTFTMPIRVVALRGSEVLYSELHKFSVTVDRASGASQFIFNDPNVTIPSVSDGSVQIFAGYDEGPEKKKTE